MADNEIVLDWDPAKTLDCSRSFTVDIDTILEAARVPAGSELAFVCSWWSPGTGLRGKGSELSFRTGLGTSIEVNLSLGLPGESLRTSVQLRTSLVLIARPTSSRFDALSARQRGSILWQDHVNLILEGNAPRFPITLTNFAENNWGDARTCWRFEWIPKDLSAPAMGAFRLWINSQNEHFSKALVATPPAPEDLIVRSALRFLVAQEMFNSALDMADDIDHGEFDSSSCGQVLKDLMSRIFPGQGANEIKEFRKQDPAEFSGILQSRLAIFESKAGSII